MSFGFSVGDFLAVIQLARKIYDGCKSASDQYMDVGRDVGNSLIVFGAIERYWREEMARGRDLSPVDRGHLQELAKQCLEVLKRLDVLLRKNQKLRDKPTIARRMRWYASSREMGPLRASLQRHTSSLAIFNATLTASLAAERADHHTELLRSQARILEFFAGRYSQLQNGTGDPDTNLLSQTAMMGLLEQNENSWRSVNDELSQAGFSMADIQENRAFIQNWIGTVVSGSENGDPFSDFEQRSYSTIEPERSIDGPSVEASSSAGYRRKPSSNDADGGKEYRANLQQPEQFYTDEREVRAGDGQEQVRSDIARNVEFQEAKYLQRRTKQDAQRFERLALTSPEALRKIRDLVRKRYQLDMEIWSLKGVRGSDRPIVLEKMERADSVLVEIFSMVETWEENSTVWTQEEWKLAQEVKSRILADGKRWWKDNPPWNEG